MFIQTVRQKQIHQTLTSDYESASARAFPHPFDLCPAALVMLREELEHVLQALTDDITGVSGTGPETER